jgi:hypothetical protein
MDAAAENPVIRGDLLQLLQDAVNRHRGPGDDIRTYVGEPVLQRLLALRNLPLPIERMRGQLYWLRDRGYVRSSETHVGASIYLAWRITDRGSDVLDRVQTDPAVVVPIA